MRAMFVLLAGLLLATADAVALEPKEKVVVIRPVEMRTITGSNVALSPGVTLTVLSVKDGEIKVAAGRVGTVESSAVIAAHDADAHFSALIEKDPQDAAALLGRGRLRFDSGDLDAAIADLDQLLNIAPSSEAHTIRGFAWKRKGDKDKAMADFNGAIKLNPKEALAWRVRGATWAGMANYPNALADYSESIRIDPENPDSLHHRVLMLAACNDPQIRDGRQAVQDATRACEVSGWKSPLYLMGLAVASAEAGDFDAAIKWQEKAIELSPDTHAKSMQTQLELYRQKQPFRMTWR